MREKSPAVYILASKRSGTLYVGVTSDFVGRVSLHKQHMIEGFSKRYGTDDLLHIEFHEDMERAIAREKQLKRWHRAWKIALIEKETQARAIFTGRCRACRKNDRHPGQGGASGADASQDPAQDSCEAHIRCTEDTWTTG